jgi:hypothetical protein
VSMLAKLVSDVVGLPQSELGAARSNIQAQVSAPVHRVRVGFLRGFIFICIFE